MPQQWFWHLSRTKKDLSHWQWIMVARNFPWKKSKEITSMKVWCGENKGLPLNIFPHKTYSRIFALTKAILRTLKLNCSTLITRVLPRQAFPWQLCNFAVAKESVLLRHYRVFTQKRHSKEGSTVLGTTVGSYLVLNKNEY